MGACHALAGGRVRGRLRTEGVAPALLRPCLPHSVRPRRRVARRARGLVVPGGVGDVLALVVLLAAQVTAVLLGALLCRRRRARPLLAFGLYGNPTMWALPIAAAAFGPR